MTTALHLPARAGAAGARLHLRQWHPAVPPRAIVLLAHGLGEHSGRYDHVAARLVAARFAVCAVDHWGHGQSDGRRGDVPDFDLFVEGMRQLLAWTGTHHPGLPRLLLGHSMGGLVAALLLAERQQDFAAAALSGAAIMPAAPPSRALRLVGGALARIAPTLGVLRLDAAAISRDPAVVAAYRADPLVHQGAVGARLGHAMLGAMERARAAAPRIDLPLLIQHGGADRLTDPAGSHYLFDHVASSDKRLEIYPGLFHEIYNEPERAAVLDHLVEWFDRHVAPDGASPGG